MKRALVLVEGPTEERVINACLRPYLEPRGMVLVPKIVATKRTIGAAHHKGARLAPSVFKDDETVVSEIAAIASKHATPEDIDDGPDTAPSKRVKRAFPRYQKTVHGIEALKSIGVDRIREACPHFASWLGALEAIAAAP